MDVPISLCMVHCYLPLLSFFLVSPTLCEARHDKCVTTAVASCLLDAASVHYSRFPRQCWWQVHTPRIPSPARHRWGCESKRNIL